MQIGAIKVLRPGVWRRWCPATRTVSYQNECRDIRHTISPSETRESAAEREMIPPRASWLDPRRCQNQTVPWRVEDVERIVIKADSRRFRTSSRIRHFGNRPGVGADGPKIQSSHHNRHTRKINFFASRFPSRHSYFPYLSP